MEEDEGGEENGGGKGGWIKIGRGNEIKQDVMMVGAHGG